MEESGGASRKNVMVSDVGECHLCFLGVGCSKLTVFVCVCVCERERESAVCVRLPCIAVTMLASEAVDNTLQMSAYEGQLAKVQAALEASSGGGSGSGGSGGSGSGAAGAGAGGDAGAGTCVAYGEDRVHAQGMLAAQRCPHACVCVVVCGCGCARVRTRVACVHPCVSVCDDRVVW